MEFCPLHGSSLRYNEELPPIVNPKKCLDSSDNYVSLKALKHYHKELLMVITLKLSCLLFVHVCFTF